MRKARFGDGAVAKERIRRSDYAKELGYAI
jgi:hypothetical protein